MNMTNKSSKKTQSSKKPYSIKQFVRDILEVVVPAVVLFLVIHSFFLESRFVPSPSMVPTIEVQDRFLLNKTAYWFKTPQRYDVIIFKPPVEAGSSEDFVKRVIGLPGETLRVHGGVVYINNKPLPEPYITPDRAPISEFGPMIIPEGQLFMMGDNRNNSQDSRYWGTLPIKDVKGQAWWRFWPLNRMGLIR